MLHLIDDHWRLVATKEVLWFLFRLFCFGRKVQGDKPILRI